MPRRTKLTPEIHKAIVQAVTGGVSLEQAAALAEIHHVTVLEWIQRGENGHPRRPAISPYAEFAADIKKARAQDEARRVLRINQAGQGGAVIYERTITYPDGRVEREVKRSGPQWQADAWWLERTRAEVYGRREKVDVRMTIQQAAQKVAEELGMTPEEVLTEAQQILAML